MLVRDLMNTNVVSVSPDESTTLAARLLYRHNVGSLPVCSTDGRLRGIVTDRDIIMRCVASECDPAVTKVREIMTRGVVSVAPDTDLQTAGQLMASEQVRRLPVLDDGKIVGMLALGDLAKNQQYDMEAAKALSEISENIRRFKC